MPEADSIIAIWFKLLCMAGKHNNGGVFMLSDKVAYTDEMFATIFRRPLNTVRLALKTFETFGMVEIVNNTYTIPNWSKHQSLDAYEKRKERDRLYQAERRAAQRALAEKSSDTSSDTSSDIAFLEEEKEKEEDKKKIRERIDYDQIKDLYNDICISLPRLTVLSDKRKKAIKARLNAYTIEQFTEVFKKAQASAFLTGSNQRNWQANFDWLIRDGNFAKVLDGNYDNSGNKIGKNCSVSSLDTAGFDRMVEDYIPTLPKTAADDDSIKAKAEALNRQIAGG
jgi:predicted phage replisome organizer